MSRTVTSRGPAQARRPDRVEPRQTRLFDSEDVRRQISTVKNPTWCLLWAAFDGDEAPGIGLPSAAERLDLLGRALRPFDNFRARNVRTTELSGHERTKAPISLSARVQGAAW